MRGNRACEATANHRVVDVDGRAVIPLRDRATSVRASLLKPLSGTDDAACGQALDISGRVPQLGEHVRRIGPDARRGRRPRPGHPVERTPDPANGSSRLQAEGLADRTGKARCTALFLLVVRARVE